MIPINILSKLSRPHIVISRKTLETSAALWKLKEECPNKPKHSKKQVCSKREEGSTEKVCEMQGQGRSSQYDESKCSKIHNVKQQQMSCGTLEEDDYLEAKKQGGSSSCGPLESDKQQETHKKAAVKTGDNQQQKSKGCGCPAYDTPKRVDAKSCAQKKNVSCESTNTSMKNECPSEKDKCKREDIPKRHNYCGPSESSYKDSCKSSNRRSCDQKTRSDDPCKPNKSSLKDEECPNNCKEKNDPCENMQPSRCNKTECEEKVDPCCSDKRSSCPEECENLNANKHFKLDPCETTRKNDCPDECSKEPNKNPCPDDPCKNEVKIPILMSCCQVDAAKECICKLKELQKQWEEVVAAQEGARKGDPGKKDYEEPARRKHKRSNMIYVVLGAIITAVVYLIYNEDFEPEELLLEDVDEIKTDNHDDD